MKHISTAGFRIIILGIAFSTFFACKKVPALGEQELRKGDQGPLPAKVAGEDVSPAVTAPSVEQAMVTFLSGDVFRVREGRETVLEIGDFVQRDDAVVVNEASFCELQFGNTAIVRIEEETEVLMTAIFLQAEQKDVELNITSGSVMAKVNKLTGKETFAIRTQTAVCGVRGTVFVVRAREGGETTLAVKEGKVAVLPASVDIKKMKESLPEGQEDLIRNLEEFEVNAASVVEPGKEVVIDMATLRKTDERLKQLESAIQEISEEQDETVRAEKIQNVLSEVETLSAEVAKTIPEAREISTENSRELEKIEQSRFIDIPTEPSGDEVAAPQAELGKIVLKVTPEDASILVNGVVAGRKQYSGMFFYGEAVSFTIRKEGYEEKTLIIEVSEETSLSYEVKLDPIEPAGPELRTVTVTVTPDDARILLDQDVVGSGSFSGEFEVGSTLLFTIQKDGFTEETLNVEVDPDSDHAYSVVLGASYGGIRLENTGVDGKYTVYIDGNRKGENLTTVSRLAAGERRLEIKQKRMLGDIVIYSETVTVPPGKDVTVSFAIPDLMEEEQAKLTEIETFVRDSFDSKEAKDKVEEKLEEALSMLEDADLSEALKEEKDKFEQLRAEHKKKWIIW